MEPAKRNEFLTSLGNFEVVLDLKGNRLILEMTSMLDGKLYRYEATDDDLDKTLKEFFMSTANLHAVLEQLLKTKEGIIATDLSQLRFSIVACKIGAREIRKDFEIQPKEIEMDKFDRLERVVKKFTRKSHEAQGMDGYYKLKFQPDKSLNSFANIVQDGDVFSNKANGSWQSLYSQSPIPEKGKFYYEIEFVKWGHANRNLMIGIGSANLRPQVSSYGNADCISLYIANNNTASLYERGGNFRVGSFGYFEEGDRLVVKINMDTSVISWCFGGETIMMTRIGKDLKAKQLHIKVQFCYNTEKIRFL